MAQDTVYGLAASAGVVYAARQSGLARSFDAGRTWDDAFANLRDWQPSPVTAAALHGDTVLAGVKGAVVCSTDAGANWNIVGLASPPPTVTAIAISPNFVADGTALVGTADDGVFVTTDCGAHWTAWNFGLVDMHVYALAFSPAYGDDKLILAGTESGLFSSRNGGRGWSEIDFPMSAAPVISLAFAPTFATDGRVYAGTEASGLFVSTDHGSKWHPVDDALLSGGVNAVLMAGKPEANVYALLEDKVVLSADSGVTWQPSTIRLPSGSVPMSLCLHPTDASALLLGFADGEILSTA
ncbi:MAG: hypothetical protein LCI00_09575 [Chloroflexi bacterium]|nr:hypothetical protein [Chloroflexota bacterium]MCC6893025.1 hypothetical protein [Anaerolineae bacterium]